MNKTEYQPHVDRRGDVERGDRLAGIGGERRAEDAFDRPRRLSYTGRSG